MNGMMFVAKWSILGGLLTGWLLRAWFNPSFQTIIESAVGCMIAFLLLTLFLKQHNPQVIWHEEYKMLAVVRTWIVETSAALLLTTMPIGIDLSHSANKVLGSISTRFANTRTHAELRFFVSRPLGNRVTLVGFMVVRKFPRLSGTISRLIKILNEDMEVLEGIMRSVYHHVPVEKAGREEMIAISSGGTRYHG